MAAGRILLELKGVGKSFGATRVLEQIDLAVEDGEFITILGPSGSGKTTILRMIGGFAQPDQGQILLDGEDIGQKGEVVCSTLRSSTMSCIAMYHVIATITRQQRTWPQSSFN